MMKVSLALAASLLSACPALAAVETHSVDYSYSIAENGDNLPRLTFPGFDDLGGQRTLTRVDVRVQTTVAATIAIENKTEAPLAGWQLDGQHTVLTGFERQNPESFGPFAFLGGLNIEPFTATLAPADATPGSGDDVFSFSDSVTIDSTLDMDPSYLDFFNGGGEVFAIIGPFTEFFLDGATLYDEFQLTGDATVAFTKLSQAGTLSVIYEYAAVPEPTGLLALAGTGLLVRRRRR
jgi:hypothetical protein